MKRRYTRFGMGILLAAWAIPIGAARSADPAAVAFKTAPGRVEIFVGGEPLGTYVYDDPKIPRPYLAHLRAPGGIQVTRNHPPIPGRDPTDHAELHPGLWMAFGDLDGADSWRLKAPIRHAGFAESPTPGAEQGHFTVRNLHLTGEPSGRLICEEICRIGIAATPFGHLVLWDSTFHATDAAFAFGDQEEMGLGVRVVTPIAVKQGGRMRDSEGRVNEKQIWGNRASWCDYSGLIDGQQAGVLLMADPANSRPTRFHARDYGALVANPFGQKVFVGGSASRVVVAAGASLRLRYGVLLYASPPGGKIDPAAAYGDFLARLPGSQGVEK